MLIVYDRPGQLANQLWAFTNMITLSRACRARVVIVMRREYLSMLNRKLIKTAGNISIYAEDSAAGKCVKQLTEFLKYRQAIGGMLNKMISWLPLEVINGFVPEDSFVNKYRKGRYYIINSWEMRLNHELFIQQNAFIRDLIQPEAAIKLAAEKLMQEMWEKETVVVGVHIRRGDYREFLGGKYFFDDSVYYSYMEKLTRLLSPYKVRFRIFSHEPIELKNFPGLDIYSSHALAPIGDLWAMSFCNLIIGPVSTFSMWAGFWGQVPVYFMTGAASELSLHSFRRVIAQDSFRDSCRTKAA